MELGQALWVSNLAPGLGFEPRLPDPESSVLPLDDPGLPNATSVIISYLLQELYNSC